MSARAVRRPPRSADRPSKRLLYPRDLAYSRSGVRAPAARRIALSRVPLPSRTLLAHERDMNGRLERHFNERLVITVMSARVGRHWYVRRACTGRPAAMCAARVGLGPAAAKEAGARLGDSIEVLAPI